MQNFEILIEENAFGVTRPVEVAADIPVATLIPLLVAELRLPGTDLFGKRLFYKLRRLPDGLVIPEGSTLRAQGIRPGSRFSLDSYVEENSLPGLYSNLVSAKPPIPAGMNADLHNSATLSDEVAFAADEDDELFQPLETEKTRRGFLLLAGAALGAGTVGIGYAAYLVWTGGSLNQLIPGKTQQNATSSQMMTSVKQTPKTAAVVIPTKATLARMLQQHTQAVRSLSWSTASNLLASGADDQKLLVWNVNGAVQQTIPLDASVRALAWAADGQRVAVGAGNAVLFYNGQSGQLLGQGQQHAQAVLALDWAQHGQMQVVSGSQDTRAVVWDTTQYQPHFTFARHTSAILGVTWAADGATVASSTQGGFIRVWNGNTGAEPHGYFMDGTIPMRAAVFSPTGMMLAVGGNDGAIRLWQNGLQCQQQQGSQFGPQCVDQPLHLHATNSPVRALAWSADGHFLASGSEDGTIALWYPGQKQTPLLVVKQNAIVRSLVFSPDGKMLASGAGNQILLWALA